MPNPRMNCCETCHVYWTCETKWYRGEKGEENICCPVCNYFRVCSAEKGRHENNPKSK